MAIVGKGPAARLLDFVRELVQGEQESEVRGASLSAWTLRVKLMTIITAIIALALLVMIVLMTIFTVRDGRIRVEEANTRVTETASASVLTILASARQSAQIAADTLQRNPAQKGAVARSIFGGNQDWVMLGVYRRAGGGLANEQSLIDDSFLEEKGLSAAELAGAIQRHQAELSRAAAGGVALINVSPALRTPVAGLAFDLGGGRLAVALLRMEAFLNAFQSRGIAITFLVSEEGVAIAHPDTRVALAAQNLSQMPIVQAMRASPIDNGLGRYVGLDGDHYLASFQRLRQGGGGVITMVPEDKAFEEIYNIRRRNIYLTLIVTAAAVLIVYFFARSISRPVKRLTQAARMIEEGQYDIRLTPSTRDEVGALTQSFNSMATGLKERENLKTSFGRFVNKELAELSLSGELRPGGERKEVAIFFSDIRGFTGISEKLRAEDVVDMLNAYFTEMVRCVNESHGTVDKFIGDAIMATWGALRTQGNPVENAFQAALLMRARLAAFNRGRGSARKPIIRIGCGINAGSVIAGQIGSDEKLEYTVIGDAVNIASRVEGLTRKHGVDVLVTQEALDRVRGLFRAELIDETQVKGRSKAVRVYALLGRIGDADAPESAAALRRRLGGEAVKAGRRR